MKGGGGIQLDITEKKLTPKSFALLGLNAYSLFLGNISKYFQLILWKRKD